MATHCPGSIAKTQPLYTGLELNLGDRVLGEAEKNSFYCFARQKGPQGANALKTVCPVLEGVVRSVIVMAQGAERDQLMDILLIGWW